MFRYLMGLPIFQSVLRPVTRFIVGFTAIPVFRFLLRRVFKLQDLDGELEKDLEEWFRGSLLLLAASANMEHLLFHWVHHFDWLTIGLRLMLAIGVIEAMPDQELFAVIHPGPPTIKPGRKYLARLWKARREIIRGVTCQYLNRSSPVLAIMAAIFGAELVADTTPEQYKKAFEQWIVGWTCFGLAITQYLIIGLVTSRDRAMDVLSRFDQAVAARRRELIEEFHLESVESRAQEQAAESLNQPVDHQPSKTPPQSDAAENNIAPTIGDAAPATASPADSNDAPG